MFVLVNNMRDLRFRELMEVYAQTNQETGREEWPDLPAAFSQEMAEQSFYQYLKELFFPTSGAVYFIWEEKGCYVSAFRVEPYRDGLLLEGLETAPAHRRKGYAFQLIQQALKYLSDAGPVIIYSHIHKKNMFSLSLHKKCGFQMLSDHAVYIDGSVNHRAFTYIYQR